MTKKTWGTTTYTETGIHDVVSENQQLLNDLHKPITRKFKKSKVNLSYWDKYLDAGLAYMQLKSGITI